MSDVVPAKGELLRSTDGGHTWEQSAGPVPVEDVYGMACPSAQQCAMVGTFWFGLPEVGVGSVAQSIDAGSTFRSSPTSYTPITLTAVACPSTSRCIAVGGHTVAKVTLLHPTHRRGTATTEATDGSLHDDHRGAGDHRGAHHDDDGPPDHDDRGADDHHRAADDHDHRGPGHLSPQWAAGAPAPYRWSRPPEKIPRQRGHTPVDSGTAVRL